MDGGGRDLIFQKAEEEACDISAGAADLAGGGGGRPPGIQGCIDEAIENRSIAADTSTVTSSGLRETAPVKENYPLVAGKNLTKLTNRFRLKCIDRKRKLRNVKPRYKKA